MLHRKVPHEYPIPGRRFTNRSRCTEDAGQLLKCRLDLAQLYAAPADFYLVVDSTLKDQPRALEANVVATAVGPLPPELFLRGVLLGIHHRVEVARETNTTDDQFADLALDGWLAGGWVGRTMPSMSVSPRTMDLSWGLPSIVDAPNLDPTANDDG